jgi:hypothetical protein
MTLAGDGAVDETPAMKNAIVGCRRVDRRPVEVVGR